MALADCVAISQELAQESGRYSSKFFQTHFADSIWVGAVEQMPWEDGLGFSPTTLIRERSIAPTRLAWTAITSANSCDPPVDVIPNAWTNRQFSRYQKEFQSEWLCVNELRASIEAAQQIDMMLQNIEENIVREWMLQTRDWYFDNCAHKICVLNGDPESSGAAFPAVRPTSALTKGVLDRAYLRMVRDGGAKGGGAWGYAQGAPIFPVIASQEAIDGIIKLNTDIRQDVRWSNRAEILLEPMGMFKTYGNYVFIPDLMPMRFNWNGSNGFVRVAEYTPTPASVGNSAELSTAYLNAEFEVSFMFNPLVYQKLIPAPAFSAGAAKFAPHNYMGEVTFISAYDLQCNHLSNKGYFLGLLSAAPKPIQTRYGYAFLHLRCGSDNAPIVCPTGSGYPD